MVAATTARAASELPSSADVARKLGCGEPEFWIFFAPPATVAPAPGTDHVTAAPAPALAPVIRTTLSVRGIFPIVQPPIMLGHEPGVAKAQHQGHGPPVTRRPQTAL